MKTRSRIFISTILLAILAGGIWTAYRAKYSATAEDLLSDSSMRSAGTGAISSGGIGNLSGVLGSAQVPPKSAALSLSPTPSPIPHRPLDAEREWKEFTKKFGSELKPEFSKGGQLVKVTGNGTKAKMNHPEFRPDEPKMAISRAREVIAAADELMGVRSDWPLESVATKGTPLSAQVFFNQTHEGMTVEPVGNIKIDLGADGELTGLYSDYAPQIIVTNEVRLDSEQAKANLLASIRNPAHVEGGSRVIWMVSERDGHVAYQFSVDGRQVVVDAENGKILYTRDRRNF